VGGTSTISPASAPGGDDEAEDGARFVLAVYRPGEMEQPQSSTSTNMPVAASAAAAAGGEAGAAHQPHLSNTNDC